MAMNVDAKQLDPASWSYLDQSEFYQAQDNLLKLTAKEENVRTKLPGLIGDWSTALISFDEAYRRALQLLKTKSVKALDGTRDKTYTWFASSIRNYLNSPVEAQRTAAEQLDEVLTRYNVKVSASYQQESMRITQLCQELSGSARLTKHLQTLGLKEWADLLAQQNNDFIEAINARTSDQAGFEAGELVELRRALERAYRRFAKMLNAVVLYEGDDDYASYIDQMNAEIRTNRLIIARKQGRKTDDETPEPEPDEKQDDK